MIHIHSFDKIRYLTCRKIGSTEHSLIHNQSAAYTCAKHHDEYIVIALAISLPGLRKCCAFSIIFKGHIDAVRGSADTSTGAVLLRASFNNPSEVFRNGSNGYIELPSTKHGVITIPQDAVIHIQDKYFVYRVIEGKAVSTEIMVLPSADNLHYVVISGLNERDVIIAENAGMVSEGMAIAQETKKTEP
jgi:hypothetical protein